MMQVKCQPTCTHSNHAIWVIFLCRGGQCICTNHGQALVPTCCSGPVNASLTFVTISATLAGDANACKHRYLDLV